MKLRMWSWIVLPLIAACDADSGSIQPQPGAAQGGSLATSSQPPTAGAGLAGSSAGTAGTNPGGPVAGQPARPTQTPPGGPIPAGRGAPGAAGTGAVAAAGTGASLPTGGVAGASGSATAGAAALPPGNDNPSAGPVCKGNPSQVVIIGDSFINWTSHTLPADLAAEAGETWRLYAEGGASLQAGGIATLITDQFENAVREDPDIKVLVMDGSGNDVLLSDAIKYPDGQSCKEAGSSQLDVCKQIVVDTLAAFEKLQTRAVEVGIGDIVFFFYPNVPTGTIIGGAEPNEVAAYALPMWKASCEGAAARHDGKLRCHFVDMVPVFEGHPDWFAPTDIHPNSTGSAAMAKAIVGKMKEDCVWQAAESGCCTPQ